MLTPGSSSDTVTIKKAVYTTAQQTLAVQATDSDPGAILKVYVTSTDTLLGTLKKKRAGYGGRFLVSSNPENITVKSNLGGSATAAVTTR